MPVDDSITSELMITKAERQRRAKCAYAKAFREANPEKIRAARKAYYAANKEKVKAQIEAWNQANPERKAASMKAWYEANRERVKERMRSRRKTKGDEVRAKEKAYLDAHPERRRAKRTAQRARAFGTTVDEITGLEKLHTSCQICRTPFTLTEACIDHDHRTGKVRGRLCQPCNNGLGRFRDDPRLLRAAIRYLKLTSHA